MTLHLLYRFYEYFNTDKISIIYQGNFSDSITDKILSLSDHNISSDEAIKKLRKRVSFIMVESFQNIVRHAPNVENEIFNDGNSSIFIVRNIDKTFFVSSINLIENDKIEDLERKLNRINDLDKDELKNLFVNILSDESISEKGGAGLGLIEMARKSDNKVSFDFTKVNSAKSFFYLEIKVNKGENNINDQDHIELSKQLHLDIIKDNILLIYKGDFSQDSVLPVVTMVEENLAHSDTIVAQRKKTFNVLVEVLQNIAKHSLGDDDDQNGLFMIGEELDKSIIYAGNFIATEDVPELETHLKNVQGKNINELNDMYRKTLREGPKKNTGGAGLGIIDIARDSEGNIDFNFKKVDNEKTFYSICVKV